MSLEQMLRPNFFEGQFLGAADLDLAVEYNRFRHARHALGAHTWGIAMGLQLKEEESAGGAVDVAVQPGFAVDGFGRQMVVDTPHGLSADLFQSITAAPGSPSPEVQVRVWIRFRGDQTSSPAAGFEVCDADDQFARLQESYEIVLSREGELSHAEQHDQITVADVSVDALETPPTRQAADPVHCDESVPYQKFPSTDEDPDRQWLVPLGLVKWDTTNSRLVELSEDEQRLSRSYRRYLGAVAEEVFAADGLIRLRRRETEPPPDDTTPIDSVCDPLRIRTGEDEDLHVNDDTQRLEPIDLVWIEGNLRLLGHAKIVNGDVDFRTAAQTSEFFTLRRRDGNAAGGNDVQVAIGAETDGQNRFAVGPIDAADADATLVEQFVVLDDARVGIGTGAPTEALEVRGDILLGNGSEYHAAAVHQPRLIVVGRVTSNGQTDGGDNFTVTKTGTGRYEVEFAQDFAEMPIVVVTLLNATNDDNVVAVENVEVGKFDVVVQDVDGGEQATAFNFMAAGRWKS